MLVNSGNGEYRLSKEVCKGLALWGMVDCIESGLTCAGRPDLDYCIQGVQGQIELKYINGKTLKKEFIRSSQVRWFKRRIQHGGFPLLLTKVELPDEHIPIYLLHAGLHIETLAKIRFTDQFIAVANRLWENKINWDEFAEILIKPCGVYNGI